MEIDGGNAPGPQEPIVHTYILPTTYGCGISLDTDTGLANRPLQPLLSLEWELGRDMPLAQFGIWAVWPRLADGSCSDAIMNSRCGSVASPACLSM